MAVPTPPGRHRRHGPPPPGRPALLTLLATLFILLGSGVAAVGLTGYDPTAPSPAGHTGIGEAPRGVAAVGTAPALPSDDLDSRAEPPTSRGERPEPTDGGAGPDDGGSQPGQQGGDQGSDDRGGGDRGGGDSRDPGDSDITGLEEQVLSLTNAARVAAGCGELTMDDRLRVAARGHSEDMVARGYFSHTSPEGTGPSERAQAAGWPGGAGENIAMGYRTPDAVMDGWMNSEGHRNNLLNCGYTDIGVGVAADDRGRLYWTQNFGRR